MPGAASTPPEWVIDTHGMVDALTTTQNSTRVAVIDAIESGAMMVLKPVSSEMKNLYPHLWADFKAINNKKYLPVTVKTVQAGTMLSETYGASILGSMPSGAHFNAVAAATAAGAKLVTAGKALTHCKAIVRRCSLQSGSAVPIDNVLTCARTATATSGCSIGNNR